MCWTSHTCQSASLDQVEWNISFVRKQASGKNWTKFEIGSMHRVPCSALHRRRTLLAVTVLRHYNVDLIHTKLPAINDSNESKIDAIVYMCAMACDVQTNWDVKDTRADAIFSIEIEYVRRGIRSIRFGMRIRWINWSISRCGDRSGDIQINRFRLLNRCKMCRCASATAMRRAKYTASGNAATR